MINNDYKLDPNIDLYKPIHTLILPILHFASTVEQTFGEFLLPPSVGIYKFGDLEPVIKNGVSYYTHKNENGNFSTVLVEDFNTTVDGVYDSNGSLVIPSFMMRDKKRYLSNTPMLPSRGAFILKHLIDQQISAITPWTARALTFSNVCKYFKPENTDIVEEGYLEKLAQPLLSQVHSFINNDVWNIYYVNIKGQDLCVDKCMDYRIYDWTINELQRRDSGQ